MAKPHILVVEDEGIVAWELQEMLLKMGYHVPTVAASGKEALASVVADCPDLIIMDVRLDGPIDGVETAKRIKDICAVPVVYLTADSSEATLEKATATNAYGYILKPFEERALRAALEIALTRGKKELRTKEEQEWNEIILKNLRDGIIATDTKGLITRCNAVALSLLRCAEKDCLGKRFTTLVRIVDEKTLVPEALSVTKTIIDNEAVAKAGCRLAVNERESIPIEYRLAPLKNKNDNTIGAILFLKTRD